MKKLIVTVLITVFTASSVIPTIAADDKPSDKKEAPARAIPFRGKIAAVDKQAKTVKVGERTFHITSDSKIAKAGKPATLDDAATGEEVGGAYREGADKKLNVVSMRIGPRPEPAPKQGDKK